MEGGAGAQWPLSKNLYAVAQLVCRRISLDGINFKGAEASLISSVFMNHFSLGVEDMDATDAALQRAGWKPHGEEHKQMGLDGKFQLNVFDPDDVRVEFMTFTPSGKPCCSDFTGPHPRP